MAKPALLGGDPVRTRPFPSWPQSGPEEERALLEVLRSGRWFEHNGDRVERFERAFAEAHDARFGVTTNAGTTALWLALYAAGIRAGHEVIVPTYTFVATAAAVLMTGAVPVFADIDEETWNLDPTAVEPLVNDRTRAILPVHFGGYPADLDAIGEIARRHGLVLIEDAAHAHGSVYRGRKLGAHGAAGAFSFQESKNITAGEGGIVLTDSEAIADAAYGVKMYGRPRHGEVWYDHAGFGGNFRITEFQAAILLAQLDRLEDQARRRWENARILEDALRELPAVHPQGRDDPRVTRRSYHLVLWRYVAAEADGLPRARFLEALREEGIPVGDGYRMPLHRQPMFTDRTRLAGECPTACLYDGLPPDYAAVQTPVAARLCTEEAVWLPHATLLGTADDTRDIVDAVAKVLAHRHGLLNARPAVG